MGLLVLNQCYSPGDQREHYVRETLPDGHVVPCPWRHPSYAQTSRRSRQCVRSRAIAILPPPRRTAAYNRTQPVCPAHTLETLAPTCLLPLSSWQRLSRENLSHHHFVVIRENLLHLSSVQLFYSLTSGTYIFHYF